MTRSKAGGKVTPAMRRRLYELDREGLSQRDIAERLQAEGFPQIDHKTVGTELKRPRPPEPVDVAAIEADVAQIDDAAPSAMRRLHERLDQVSRITDALVEEVASGNYQATQWGKLVDIEGELAGRILKLTPPEPPDPEKDPSNLSARDELLARLERAVSDLEREPLVRAAMRAHLDALEQKETAA